nr:MAG TPA: hypothetical protein [Caudoviricetes sp.]
MHLNQYTNSKDWLNLTIPPALVVLFRIVTDTKD